MMKRLIFTLLLLPLQSYAVDIAISPNGMMGMTVLTNEPCTSNKDLYAAYAYNLNKTIVYACWKIDGEDIVFLNSFPQLIKIPVKQFIKTPKLNDPR